MVGVTAHIRLYRLTVVTAVLSHLDIGCGPFENVITDLTGVVLLLVLAVLFRIMFWTTAQKGAALQRSLGKLAVI